MPVQRKLKAVVREEKKEEPVAAMGGIMSILARRAAIKGSDSSSSDSWSDDDDSACFSKSIEVADIFKAQCFSLYDINVISSFLIFNTISLIKKIL